MNANSRNRDGDTALSRAVSDNSGIVEISRIATETNANVENIGARRLQTVMERLLDEISFLAPDRSGDTVTVDAAYVEQHVGSLARNTDLSKFIL